MKLQKKFFVWARTGHIPKFEHDSFESARVESERLAKQNPGTRFYVLESVGVAVKKEVDFYEIKKEQEEIPF